MNASKSQNLLQVRDLSLDVLTEQGRFPLVQNISFDLEAGKVLGIVGESGSGKTVTCMGLTRLLPEPPIYYREGEVWLNGQDLWKLPPDQIIKKRGSEIGIIFQEALSALNPVIRVGKQVEEVLRHHFDLSKSEAYQEAIELFNQVGIPSPEIRYNHYPHQLSGGLQQRIMIAMALAGDPHLLIADEPTTALDVTIQVQIMELLKNLQRQREMAIIFVSHDLGLIAELCDHVLVMYAGEIVEYGGVHEIFDSPAHPYTQLLIRTIPRIQSERGKFVEIPGQVPSPANYPEGCRFHPRCPFADGKCKEEAPDVFILNPSHRYRCWHPDLKGSTISKKHSCQQNT